MAVTELYSNSDARIDYSGGGRLRGLSSQRAPVHVHMMLNMISKLFCVSVVGNSHLLRYLAGLSVINTAWPQGPVSSPGGSMVVH